MTVQDFVRSTELETLPPEGLALPLQALWYDKKGDWETAHTIAQASQCRGGEWVHAYLHRKEGDQENASYWYARCRKSKPNISLEEEWADIAETLLAE